MVGLPQPSSPILVKFKKMGGGTLKPSILLTQATRPMETPGGTLICEKEAHPPLLVKAHHFALLFIFLMGPQTLLNWDRGSLMLY